VVAQRIWKAIPGVTVFDQAAFFEAGHAQLAQPSGRFRVLGSTWFLSSVFIGMIFMIASTNAAEIGLLRRPGFTRKSVLSLLLRRGSACPGWNAAVCCRPARRNGSGRRSSIFGLPLASPSRPGMIAMVLGSLALTLVSVSLAVLFRRGGSIGGNWQQS